MKCDVLIVYEHRSREIENACLLAVELETRGYCVIIRHIESLQKYFIKAKVVITPHLYNNQQILVHAKNFWKNHKNLISLQYEQVLSTSASSDKENIHDPKEEAVYAQHIAWGESQKQRYLDNKIDIQHIHTVGNLAMDILSPLFDSYFISRAELANKYCIDKNKKWLLFMSSFSYADRTEKEIIAFEKLNPSARVFAKLSDKSKVLIIDWIEQLASDYPNMEIIYRPHPHEQKSNLLDEMSAKHGNIHVIGDYSVRQWVKSADILYTWYSTSIADACYAQKPCGILRPVPIPYELEVDIMTDAKLIESYTDFKKSVSKNDGQYSVDLNKISFYYGEIKEKNAFIEIANLCEKMMDGSMEYNYTYPGSRFNILNDDNIKSQIKTFIWHLVSDLTVYVKLSKMLPKMFFTDTLLNFEKENYQVFKEIKETKNRFRPIISKLHKQ